MTSAAILSWIAGALMLLFAVLAVMSYSSSKKRIWVVTASIAFIAAVLQFATAVIHMRQ